MSKRKSIGNRVTEVSTIFGITLLLVLLGVFAYFMITANEKSKDIREQLSVDILFHDDVKVVDVLQMEKQLTSLKYIKQAQYTLSDTPDSVLVCNVGI